jgi:hypothetical protein
MLRNLSAHEYVRGIEAMFQRVLIKLVDLELIIYLLVINCVPVAGHRFARRDAQTQLHAQMENPIAIVIKTQDLSKKCTLLNCACIDRIRTRFNKIK